MELDLISGNILLLGVIDSGKSLLGNFLLNGTPSYTPFINREHKDQSNLIKVESFVILKKRTDANNVDLEQKIKCQIIDTPGSYDERMLDSDIIQHIRDNINKTEINLTLIVVKLGFKIDDDRSNLMSYYFNMLPQIKERNLRVVITNVKMLDCDTDVLSNTKNEITGMLGRTPIFHTIDTLARNPDDLNHAKSVRIELLEAFSKNHPILVELRSMPKTTEMLKSDLELLKLKILERDDHKRDILANKIDLEILSSQMNSNFNKQHENESMIRLLNEKLSFLISDELVLIENIPISPNTTFDSGWHFQCYEIKTLHSIRNQSITTNYEAYSSLSEGRLGDTNITIKVSSDMWCELTGTIEIHSIRREVFSTEIENQNVELSELSNERNDLLSEIDHLLRENKHRLNKINALSQKILENNIEIASLRKRFVIM